MADSDSPSVTLPLEGRKGLGSFPPIWLMLGSAGSAFLFTAFLLLLLPHSLIAASKTADNDISLLVLVVGAALTLLVGALFSDVFRDPKRRTQLLVSSIIVCILSTLATFLNLLGEQPLFHYIFVFLISVGQMTLMLLWSICFCSIRRGVIGSFLAATLLLTGVLFSIVCLFQDVPRLLTSLILPLISAAFYIILQIRIMDEFSYPTRTISNKRCALEKNSLWTTLITGMPLGIVSYFLVSQTLHSNTFALVIGLPLLLAGIVMVIDLLFFKKFSEARFLHIFPVIALPPILLIAFLPPSWQLFCCAYLVFAISCYSVMCFLAIAETTSFNRLAVFWTSGISWFFYVCGLILGWAIPWLTRFADDQQFTLTLVLLGLGYLIVASGLIFRDNSVVDEPKSDEIGARMKSLSWKEKIHRAGELYELSPRQQEVLVMLARGRNASYLEEHFFISRSTAKAHIANIYKKFGVHSQQSLIDFIESINEIKSTNDTHVS